MPSQNTNSNNLDSYQYEIVKPNGVIVTGFIKSSDLAEVKRLVEKRHDNLFLRKCNWLISRFNIDTQQWQQVEMEKNILTAPQAGGAVLEGLRRQRVERILADRKARAEESNATSTPIKHAPTGAAVVGGTATTYTAYQSHPRYSVVRA